VCEVFHPPKHKEDVLSTIKFETPEPARSGKPRHNWAEIAAQLRKRPGEWAVIDEDCPKTQGGNFSRGGNKAFRPVGAWEFTVRGASKSRAEKLYGRFVGEKGEFK
jgi:hypothetical protein